MNRLRGFTLTELLITIVIAAMIVSAAIPALISSTQNNRLTAYSNELITALNIARIKAIETGRAVSVCPSSNGIACAGSSDWSGERRDSILESGKTTRIDLPTPLPVLLTYWTAWVEGGQVQFREDIYERDQRILKALNGRFR